MRTSAVLQDLGIHCGDRVATLAWNTRSHLEVLYGIIGMGAICHTLNPRLVCAQLAAMVMQSGARILVVSGDLEPLAREIAEGAARVNRVLIIDALKGAVEPRSEKPHVGALEPLIGGAHSDGITWGAFSETSPFGLCFTSGTTGAPKGVTYTHRSSFLHTLRLLQVDVMAISGADSVLAVVPMFHANAWVWLGLVEHLEARGGRLPSLKRIIMGGAPVPPALMERIEQRLGVTVQTSWGMTELSPSGTVSRHYDAARSAAASGRPAIGVDLLITDADGQPLPEQREVEGHLHVRGAAVIQRYFGEESVATDEAGWFPTGDLARIDADGNLIIVGRAKDLIKSGGEWINPAEIEAVIGAIPEVSLAAVIGRSDPKWGERPILLVEMRGDPCISDEALLAPLQGRVASWWIPDAVVRLPRMPLAPTGKIDKVRLKAQYGGER
jgi:fatty-acyl-CoA synthase